MLLRHFKNISIRSHWKWTLFTSKVTNLIEKFHVKMTPSVDIVVNQDLFDQLLPDLPWFYPDQAARVIVHSKLQSTKPECKCAQSENTHLLCKGKYNCTADLLFDWLWFSCFDYVKLDRDLPVWSNPNQSNRRSVVQWYFLLQSKWVFLWIDGGHFRHWRSLSKCTVVWNQVKIRVFCYCWIM